MWVCWILGRGLNAGLSNRGQHLSQTWDETSSLLTLTKRTHAPTDSKSPRELSSQHMDTKNDSRGRSEERVREDHILQVDAPMPDNCHSVPNLGHERQVTPSPAIERLHADAGQGERAVSGGTQPKGWKLLIFYREKGRYVGSRVEIFSC